LENDAADPTSEAKQPSGIQAPRLPEASKANEPRSNDLQTNVDKSNGGKSSGNE
jgi:hypothetical protein